MVRARAVDFRRHPWTHYTVLGWRREIGYSTVTVFVLLIARSVTAWAPYVVAVGMMAVLIGNGELREKFTRQWRDAKRERTLQAVFWWTDLVGRSGRLPVVKKITVTPAGARFLLQLPVGLHLGSIEDRIEELTATFNARSISVRPTDRGARFVELSVIAQDPFFREVRSSLLTVESFNLWDALTVGVDEEGASVSVDLPEHSVLIGGEPGSGKSVALSNIIAAAALDSKCRLTLIDGKEVELLAWRSVADHFVGSSIGDAVAALEDLHDVLSERYRVLAAEGRRKVAALVGDGLHLVVIDELALFLRGGERAQRERFAELLRDLVARGRAAGIIVVAATQKPSHDIVPTWIRDLFTYRLAMRCTSPEASDTILGQGWASQGFNAATIEGERRGVGYLLAGGGSPRLIRVANLTDDDVALLVARAERTRGS